MAEQTKPRTVRMGRRWDDAQELAGLYSVTMTDFVDVALVRLMELSPEDLRAALADVRRPAPAE